MKLEVGEKGASYGKEKELCSQTDGSLIFFFFLPVSGLSCSTQDLCCGAQASL